MSASVRRRRRTVEERIGAQLRHGKPGDLAGRGEPLKRDRGAIVSRAGGPSGGDSGTVIEHLTMEAVAGQTIAAGGGTVQWGTILAPPTERRGFRTASATLAADGAVGDIPIDVTGVLNFILDGRWTTWKGLGDLTVVRNRKSGGVEERTYDLDRDGIATRAFGGDDDGWEIVAGDTLTYKLPNGSGSAQTLAEAVLVLKIIEVAASTSRDTALWLDEQVHVTSNPAVGPVLENGVAYNITILGNSRVDPTADIYDNGDPDDIRVQSDSPGSTGQAGYDYWFCYANDNDALTLPMERVANNASSPGGGWHVIDTGSGFTRVTPTGGAPASPSSDHSYTVQVTGEGQAIQIAVTDDGLQSDNNGKYRYDIARA